MGSGGTDHLRIPAPGGQSTNNPLLQLEVDRDLISPSRQKAGGGWVYLQDPAGGGHDALVHDHIAGGADDFEIGDPAVRFDLDAQAGDEVGRPGDARRLVPDAEKAVVDVLVKNTEQAIPVPPGRAGSGAGRRAAGGCAGGTSRLVGARRLGSRSGTLVLLLRVLRFGRRSFG